MGGGSASTTTTSPEIDDGASSTTAASGKAMDPCALVPITKVSAIFHEPAAVGVRSADTLECVWSKQASVDTPSVDNARDVLSAGFVEPPPGGQYKDTKAYWDDLARIVLENGGTGEDGLSSKAVRRGVRIFALAGDVILVTGATVGGDEAAAIQASRALMKAALDAR
jgi:hypothetical protein